MGARTPSALVRLRLLGGAGQQDPPQVVFNRLEARGSRKRCTPRGPKSSSSGSRSDHLRRLRTTQPKLVENTFGSRDWRELVPVFLHNQYQRLPTMDRAHWERTIMRECCLQSFMKHPKLWLPNTMLITQRGREQGDQEGSDREGKEFQHCSG
ncbi:uncharacterized protein [Triticum aestivum]|uniref:uncharacterized protein isoform X5 n=1 Tax=Triticum aestivum TaxID=4565 RepID=UPI001D032D30|nr:uncharacterized protein LOC123123731 isoform X5 [Triticum aestivum]